MKKSNSRVIKWTAKHANYFIIDIHTKSIFLHGASERFLELSMTSLAQLNYKDMILKISTAGNFILQNHTVI